MVLTKWACTEKLKSRMKDVIVSNLTKTYQKGSVSALSDISLSVEKGELFGLVGPDGAGKTTLFRILTTLLLADSGSATVNGFDVLKEFRAIRSKVGYMPGTFSLYQDLSVEENLQFFATLFRTTVRENYKLIEDIYIQLAPFKNRRAGNLSGGMKQKLALCCALIHRPQVLFLDEPTTGVDTVSRKEFWDMLKRLKSEGITILVSTPYMDEATMCERIALIQHGKILSIDSPRDIIKKYPKSLYAVKAPNMSNLLQELRMNPLVDSAFSFGEYHHITLVPESDTPVDLNHMIKSRQGDPIEISAITPTVEDCFIHLMLQNEG